MQIYKKQADNKIKLSVYKWISGSNGKNSARGMKGVVKRIIFKNVDHCKFPEQKNDIGQLTDSS